ncbi:MAG TPA: hypothetical protein VL402_03450 [Xanthobacteraceae bacterium]|nr:hypothetical protein [Xanthobacteraceae bacterium]
MPHLVNVAGEAHQAHSGHKRSIQDISLSQAPIAAVAYARVRAQPDWPKLLLSQNLE